MVRPRRLIIVPDFCLADTGSVWIPILTVYVWVEALASEDVRATGDKREGGMAVIGTDDSDIWSMWYMACRCSRRR